MLLKGRTLHEVPSDLVSGIDEERGALGQWPGVWAVTLCLQSHGQGYSRDPLEACQSSQFQYISHLTLKEGDQNRFVTPSVFTPN